MSTTGDFDYSVMDLVETLPMSSFCYIFTVLSIYLGVVAISKSSWFRRSYSPMDWIRPTMMLYDWLQIALNAALVTVVLCDSNMVRYAWMNACSLDYHVGVYEKAKLVVLGWMWMNLKVLDLFDTAFFIALKKHDHVSFLHVFHHASTVSVTWFALHFVPANQNLFMASCNSVVHVVLYYYYLASAVSEVRASWKRMLTTWQIIQFVLMIVYCMGLLMCQTDSLLVTYTTVQLLQIMTFMFLFVQFYIVKYRTAHKDD